MVSLRFTSDAFSLDGILRPGIPIFYNDRDMSILALPSLWTTWLAVVPGRTRSRHTWKAYATGLLLWLRACDVRGWNGEQLSEERLAAFRDYLDSLRDPKTKQRVYKRRSINFYLSAVCRFYEWAVRRNYLSVPLPEFEEATRIQKPSGLLAHLETAGPINRRIITLPNYDDDDDPPHYFTQYERRRLLQSMGSRDRLIARWSLYGGLRIMEAAALTINQLPVIGSYLPGRYCPIRLTITKGGRPRTIWVPSFIVDETWNYIKYDRRRAEQGARQRRHIDHRQALWLNRWGADLTDDGIRERFTNARKKAGITCGTFHGLRHTYAITMLDALLKRIADDPLKAEKRALLILKRLLGHRYTTSTEVYLQSRELNLGELLIDDLEAPDDVVEAA